MTETLLCPLQFVVDHRLALVLRCIERPEPEELEQYVHRWIHAHVDSPLREALQSYSERGFGQFYVVESSHKSMVGLLQNTRSYEKSDDEDPLQRDSVRWCIVICAQGFLVPSTPHVWFARVAAHALASRFKTNVIDVTHALCDKRYNSAHFAKPGQGFLHMSQHLRFLGSESKPGCMRLSSLGMHIFGLPELELETCPHELLHVGQMLLLGTAQHLVHAAMQYIHEADKEALVQDDPQDFGICSELAVHGALLFEATEGGANEDGGTTRVRLTLPADFQGRIIRLMPPEHMPQREEVWLQRACDELLGAPTPIQPNATAVGDEPLEHRADV
jgi:hypothetical protein